MYIANRTFSITEAVIATFQHNVSSKCHQSMRYYLLGSFLDMLATTNCPALQAFLRALLESLLGDARESHAEESFRFLLAVLFRFLLVA